MRRVIHTYAMVLTLFWAGSAGAQEVVAPEQGIEATIGSQIEAFLADDFARAFTFASPNIQGLFGSPERFGKMVQNGYPMVWRPDDVQYLELREVAGNLLQRVLIRDRAGAVHVLDYQMIQTGEGWRINGVQIIHAPGVSA